MFRHLAEWFGKDPDLLLTRHRLIRMVPDLKARQGLLRQAMLELLAKLLAPRLGVAANDRELRLVLAISLAAQAETVAHWADGKGTQSLADLLDDAYRKILPVLQIKGNSIQKAKDAVLGNKGTKKPARNFL